MPYLWKHPLGVVMASGLFVALAAVPCSVQAAPAGPEKAAEGKHEPSTIAVSIPWQWLASSGGTMTFQCEADKTASDDGVRMIESLRRDAHGRYTGKGDDGGTFHGARNGEDFTFEAVGKDGSKFVMQMPWSAARCIFGGAKLAEASSVSLRAKDVGGRLRVEVAGQTKGVSVEVKK